ncbi:Biotin carboxyl carrier protein of acetyl-CoA carboxylase 1, chloroplastic [Sesamum alatum]|uniref:Biotin carboxyl carrier protein of acetyl-CoA carboxylase 1, chloroplastic n=1 Tax=Sesamum alatum TaxID=300844 RepID=A0AAE1YUT6_9LAMI|nr:Biotin carboxyl carrier protein of acetyl-CoA carboxylase 1, chloroplastic [Sesamum alatum]
MKESSVNVEVAKWQFCKFSLVAHVSKKEWPLSPSSRTVQLQPAAVQVWCTVVITTSLVPSPPLQRCSPPADSPNLKHTLHTASAMATAFGTGTALAAASVTENACKSSTYLPLRRCHFLCGSHSDKVSFRLFAKSELRLSSKGLQSGWNCSPVARAQLKEVRSSPWISFEEIFSNLHSFVEKLLEPSVAFEVEVEGSSKTAAATPVQSEGSAAESNDVKLSNEPPPAVLGSEESISEFISQVASIIKLVDSKDIVELQLKQLNCELLIRKEEALTPPPAPITNVQLQTQPTVLAPVPTPSPVPTATPSPAPTRSPAPPKAQPSKSSHPPLKCPMAGTFYRSPAPGEPPFVKVGDKVQKGQVLCIIEAMKLMNEIEADQSGKILEILVEDGKPVSVDTPLFVIEP